MDENALKTCCIHAGLRMEAFKGFLHGSTLEGSAKRFGGAAKGTPKYWLTVAVAAGTRVVVPITTPPASVTVGSDARGTKATAAFTRPTAEVTAKV